MYGKILTTIFFMIAAVSAFAIDPIWDDRPAAEDKGKWESEWYPIGNGRLGAMIRGGIAGDRMQFNVDSLWTGDKNISGAVDDVGQTWTPLGAATGDIGGNPPALVRLTDGRLCLTYGFRRKPCGIRAKLSSDEGRTWGPEIVLRADGLTGDLGYPRSVVRPDGQVLTAYYFNGSRDEDRTIQAMLWTPPAP